MVGPGVRLTDLVALEPPTREKAATQWQFADFLDAFRGTTVLVPLVGQDALWAVELGGVRWLLAFSDEAALAQFALVRAESGAEPGGAPDGTSDAARPWDYHALLGRRLLDEIVPSVGRPCGVVLDAGSEGGTLLPPVTGIVPDRATAEAYAAEAETEANKPGDNESRGRR